MFNLAALGETTTADQKWLGVVQNMVEKGEKKVSTPSETRVQLVKEWAEKQGYSVKVTKVNNSFQVELAKHLAQR